MITAYDFAPEQLAELLIRKFFPEKTQHETVLLAQYLADYGATFDRLRLSARIGEGSPVNVAHLPGVQRAQEFSSKRRIDFIGMQGRQATLVEAKTRIGHAVMGQLLSDRQLWLEEDPNAPEPILVAVGRTATDEDLRVVSSHGITVLLYEAPNTSSETFGNNQ